MSIPIVITATEEDLKNLYEQEGAAFEQIDFFVFARPDVWDRVYGKFVSNGLSLHDGTTVYVADGKTLNSLYDLEGDNAYQEDFHMSIIPYDSCEFEDVKIEPMKKMKEALGIRWFRDIVDNNEYREYMKGRHESSEQISWLIQKQGSR